jgi:hypothetical protein
VTGGPATAGELAGAGELAATAELAGAEGGALLTTAAGALLVAGVFAAADAAVDGAVAGLDAAAWGLELLLHPASASVTDSATATEEPTLKRDNRDISQE